MSDLNLAAQFTNADAIFVASSFAGMVVHYVKKWAKDETHSSLAGWFGKDNINATLMAFGALGTAIIGALGSGLITPDMNLYALVYAGLTTGFAVDSGFNSGKKITPAVTE
jgi:hypothetical protein